MSAVPSYCGQSQQTQIKVPARIAYKYIDSEEGGWAMPPYSEIFDYSSQPPQPPPPPRVPRYKPQPWIEQIEIPYVPPVPNRITGRGACDQFVIQVGSVIPPYAQIFGYNSQPGGAAPTPPPVKQIDIFVAQQTWPL